MVYRGLGWALAGMRQTPIPTGLSRRQPLDEGPGYGLLAGQGRMHAVRSLELRVRGQPEDRLEIHHGLFLLADEISYGDDVPVREDRLAHLEGRERRGPLFVVGGRG